eukprot:364476-Chlamydomonas_euryale.AAC.7
MPAPRRSTAVRAYAPVAGPAPSPAADAGTVPHASTLGCSPEGDVAEATASFAARPAAAGSRAAAGRTPANADTRSADVDARRLTGLLRTSGSVARLAALTRSHGARFNEIHAATALVALAKLARLDGAGGAAAARPGSTVVAWEQRGASPAADDAGAEAAAWDVSDDLPDPVAGPERLAAGAPGPGSERLAAGVPGPGSERLATGAQRDGGQRTRRAPLFVRTWPPALGQEQQTLTQSSSHMGSSHAAQPPQQAVAVDATGGGEPAQAAGSSVGFSGRGAHDGVGADGHGVGAAEQLAAAARLVTGLARAHACALDARGVANSVWAAARLAQALQEAATRAGAGRAAAAAGPSDFACTTAGVDALCAAADGCWMLCEKLLATRVPQV